MAINKVVYGNDTLVDLTEDSVTANTLLEGETAHNAAGEQITGTAKQGHVVKNPSGTAMAQRANLQFVDAKVGDDSTNGATKVEVVREVTDQQWEDATEDGLYATDDDDPVFSADMISYGDGTVEEALDALNRGSMSVTADGVKTYAQLLNELYSQINLSDVTVNSKLVIAEHPCTPATIGGSYVTFSSLYVQGGVAKAVYAVLQSSSSYYLSDFASSGTTTSNISTSVPASGKVITLYY